MLSILLFLLLLFAIFFYNFFYKRRNLPPGPTPWPLVGNIVAIIRKKPGEDAFLEWKHKYGPVYTYWLGELAVVCVADYEKIVEVFQKGGDEFLGRFQFTDFTKEFRGGPYGIFFTEGEFWKEQRKFATNVFRHFGLNSNLMEEKILRELGLLFARIDGEIAGANASAGCEFDVIQHIDISVGSIINCLLFGYAYDTEARLVEFHRLLGLYMSGFSLAYEERIGSLLSTLILCSPNTFKRLPFFRERYEALMGISRGLRQFFEERIRERNALGIDHETQESTDYVEAYLKEKAKRDAAGQTDHTFSMEQLWNMCLDMWIAGQETTSTTLAWGIAHILHNQRVLDKLWEELDRVVGNPRRLITWSERTALPYTNAVVNEFLRIANMIVQNCYRRVTADVTVDGYRLSKGTCILPQISAVLIDDQFFKEPKMFNPDRFLDDSNNLIKCDQLIPFSVGKRKCFAESLARMELFLFTANVFNRYRIGMAKSPPSLSREMGITIHCPKFKCSIEKRLAHFDWEE